TTRDTVLKGFYNLKNFWVFINHWHHSRKIWKDPLTFIPECFLNPEGSKVNKTDGEKVLGFGLGKRRCIGEPIARWQVCLFLSTLLQQLEFRVCGGKKVDKAPLCGLALKHKRCEHFQAKQHLPMKSTN
ncbi:Cytochrome P450 1A5, partial [Calypte anna]